MSTQRKFMLIMCFVFIDILLLGGILLMGDITFKNILESEVTSLANADIINDKYDSKVKCIGDYGVVEGSIKDFFSDYSMRVNDTLNTINDDKLTDLLKVDSDSNISDNIEYLNTIRDEFNYNIDLLINEDISFINYRIYEETEKIYYVEVYTNLLYDDVVDKVDNTKNYLELKKAEINDYLDSIGDVLEFININNASYVSIGDNICFYDKNLEAKYNELVSKIKNPLK